MKTYRVASDTPVDARPFEGGAESTYTKTSKGVVSHKALLNEFRKKPSVRTVHSDGFLSISEFAEAAYMCECGFQGVFKRDDCIRCGAKL